MASSRNIIVLEDTSLAWSTDKSSEDFPASDCHHPHHGFKARLTPSAYCMLPRRRACQENAPLFKWTNVVELNLGVFQTGI